MATQRLVLVDEILQERMPLQISQLLMMCALKLCLAKACIQCTCSVDHQVSDSSRVSKSSLMVLATLGVKVTCKYDILWISSCSTPSLSGCH